MPLPARGRKRKPREESDNPATCFIQKGFYPLKRLRILDKQHPALHGSVYEPKRDPWVDVKNVFGCTRAKANEVFKCNAKQSAPTPSRSSKIARAPTPRVEAVKTISSARLRLEAKAILTTPLTTPAIPTPVIPTPQSPRGRLTPRITPPGTPLRESPSQQSMECSPPQRTPSPKRPTLQHSSPRSTPSAEKQPRSRKPLTVFDSPPPSAKLDDSINGTRANRKSFICAPVRRRAKCDDIFFARKMSGSPVVQPLQLSPVHTMGLGLSLIEARNPSPHVIERILSAEPLVPNAAPSQKDGATEEVRVILLSLFSAVDKKMASSKTASETCFYDIIKDAVCEETGHPFSRLNLQHLLTVARKYIRASWLPWNDSEHMMIALEEVRSTEKPELRPENLQRRYLDVEAMLRRYNGRPDPDIIPKKPEEGAENIANPSVAFADHRSPLDVSMQSMQPCTPRVERTPLPSPPINSPLGKHRKPKQQRHLDTSSAPRMCSTSALAASASYLTTPRATKQRRILITPNTDKEGKDDNDLINRVQPRNLFHEVQPRKLFQDAPDAAIADPGPGILFQDRLPRVNMS